MAVPFLLSAQGVTEQSETADTPASPVLTLKPDGGWSLHYDEDSCRVGRFFGKDDKRTLLQIAQFEPSDNFMLAVAGKGLGGKLEPGKIRIRFGPGHPYQETSPSGGNIGEFEPGLIFSSVAIREVEVPEGSPKFMGDEFYKFEPSNPITQEDESAVSWIEIEHEGQARLRLDTGPMDKLFKAADDCTDNLMRYWGLDPDEQKTKSRPAIPTRSPGNWIKAADYPKDMVRQSVSSLVYFRLMLDAEGKPQSCHIQMSTYPEEFDKAVCGKLMRRAKFKPALDKEGEPIATFYRGSVLFQTR